MTNDTRSSTGTTRRNVLKTMALGAGATTLPLWARFAQAQASQPIRIGFQAHKTGIGAAYGRWYDRTTTAAAKARGITVTNTPGVLTEDTADVAMSLMLAVPRRIAEGDTGSVLADPEVIAAYLGDDEDA